MASKNFRRKRRVQRRRKGPSNKSLNKKVRKIQDMIELKNRDTYNTLDVTTTGSLILMNGIAQAITSVGRLGNEIRATSLQVRYTLSTDPQNLASTQVRVIAFWDRQANLATATLFGALTAQPLLDTTSITDPLFAPYNYAAIDRFKVLYDKTYILKPEVVLDFDPATGATQTYCGVAINKFKVIKLGRNVKYGDTGATSASIQTNALYFAFVGDVVAASTNPQIELGTRFYFKDA